MNYNLACSGLVRIKDVTLWTLHYCFCCVIAVMLHSLKGSTVGNCYTHGAMRGVSYRYWTESHVPRH